MYFLTIIGRNTKMKIEKSKLLLTGMAGFALFLAIPLAANKANADEFEESTPGFLESIDMSNAVYSAEITSIERRMKLGYDVNAAYHDSKRGVEHDGKIKGNLLEIGVHLDTDRGALSLSGRISTGIDGEYNENTYSNSETQSLGYERVAYEAEGDSEGSIWGLNAEMQFYNAAWIKPIAGVFYEGMHFKTNDDYQGYRGYVNPPGFLGG